jgi:formylglycine-generating enzyme required for sulfatase activity
VDDLQPTIECKRKSRRRWWIVGSTVALLAVVGIVLSVVYKTWTPAESPWKPSDPPPAIAPFTPEEARRFQEMWAEHLGVPVEFENSIGMKMVLIPPGEFVMGSTEEGIAEVLKAQEMWTNGESWRNRILSEAPQHKVRITRPFYFAVCEATVGQFEAFVQATGYQTESETSEEFNWRNPAFEQTKDHPVADLSWDDAVVFCQWLSEMEGATYGLPSEAQWEYACRAGSTTPWCCGKSNVDLEKYAWFEHRGGDRSKAVGQKLPNGFGILDMHGNVVEWCSDYYSPYYYASSPSDDPVGPSIGPSRVLRGGGWSQRAIHVRSTYRLWDGIRRSVYGFRPVLLIDLNNPPNPTPKPPAEDPQPTEPSTDAPAESGG